MPLVRPFTYPPHEPYLQLSFLCCIRLDRCICNDTSVRASVLLHKSHHGQRNNRRGKRSSSCHAGSRAGSIEGWKQTLSLRKTA